jgi:hypothetical protein
MFCGKMKADLEALKSQNAELFDTYQSKFKDAERKMRTIK